MPLSLSIRHLLQNVAPVAFQVLSPLPLLGLKTRACVKYRSFLKQNFSFVALRQYLQLDFFYSRGATHRLYLGLCPRCFSYSAKSLYWKLTQYPFKGCTQGFIMHQVHHLMTFTYNSAFYSIILIYLYFYKNIKYDICDNNRLLWPIKMYFCVNLISFTNQIN